MTDGGSGYNGKLVALYDRHVTLRGRLLADVIAALLPPAGLRAVDLGCGTGYYTMLLAARHAHVLAVDTSSAALDYARHRRQPPNVTYEQRDLTAVRAACDGQFDTVLSVNALHHVAELEQAVKATAELVAPGGTLIVVDVASGQRPHAAWWIGRAVALFARDAWQRGARDAVTLARVRLHPAWLGHVRRDRPLDRAGFRELYQRAIGPAAMFVDVGADTVCVWRRPATLASYQTPAADVTADHFGIPRWHTREEFLDWLHQDGWRHLHPLHASFVENELPTRAGWTQPASR